MSDDPRNVEHHFVGGRALTNFAVDASFQNLTLRHKLGFDPRAERAEGVEALGSRPLAIAVLNVSGRNVVADGETPNVIHGVFFGYIFSELADNDYQFTLRVNIGGYLRWNHDGLFRAD